MIRNVPINGRLVGIALLAGGLLLAFVVATNSLSGAGSSTPSSTVNTPTGPGGSVAGVVTVKANHLTGHRWRFVYTVRNTGKVPIGGFQLNGPRANLFHISGRPGWTFFGSGVCGGKYPNLLIYWSTPPAGNYIAPKHKATFSFDVNMKARMSRVYALASGNASPHFGSVAAPAASSLPVGGPCR